MPGTQLEPHSPPAAGGGCCSEAVLDSSVNNANTKDCKVSHNLKKLVHDTADKDSELMQTEKAHLQGLALTREQIEDAAKLCTTIAADIKSANKMAAGLKLLLKL